MSTTVLTVNGSPVSRTGGIILNDLRLSLDQPDELTFSQFAVNMPGGFAPESPVKLTIDGTLVFSGNIFSRSISGFTRGVGNVGYRCVGLKYQAYLIPVTAADGSGQFVFNRPTTDQSYVASQSGLSIGQIFSNVFGVMSAQLAAVGITGFVSGDLSAMTVVPPDPVYLVGNSFWSQIDGILQTWYGSRYASYVTPAGIIRFIDTTALSVQTLTFGNDPVLLDGIAEDSSECYTQVILRGRSNIEPAYLSLHDGTLVDPHNASGDNLEATWSMSDFLFPKGAYSTGNVTALTSTQATVTSDVGAETWAVNKWSTLNAQISLINPASATISFSEYRRITANTALTAGGSSVITLDHALVNSGYTRYQIRGTNSTASEVYRRLNIKPSYVAQHLTQQFNFAVPWSPSQGAVVQTWYPVGVVCWTASTGAGSAPFQTPLAFEVVPYDGTNPGYIRCYQPWVSYFNTAQNLQAGGGAVVQATDIQVLVPYSRGTLQAQYPPSGYGGTAFTRFGIQRTLYRDYPSWFDFASTASMVTLAQAIHNTVANVVQEGSLTYFGLYSTALNNHVAGTPISLDIAKWTGTTSFETMAAPVREIVLEMPQAGAAGWITKLRFSTRRQQYSADRLYVHPMFLGGSAYGQMGVNTVGPTLGTMIGSAPTGTIFEAWNPMADPWSKQEMGAFGRMQGAEIIAAAGIRAAERDDRMGAAMGALEGREARAMDWMQTAETAGARDGGLNLGLATEVKPAISARERRAPHRPEDVVLEPQGES